MSHIKNFIQYIEPGAFYFALAAVFTVVTLVREQELRDLRIEDLFDEVKKRGMQSLYAPLPSCQHSPIRQGLRNNHYGLLASQVSSDQGQMDPQVHSPLDRSGGEDPQLPS